MLVFRLCRQNVTGTGAPSHFLGHLEEKWAATAAKWAFYSAGSLLFIFLLCAFCRIEGSVDNVWQTCFCSLPAVLFFLLAIQHIRCLRRVFPSPKGRWGNKRLSTLCLSADAISSMWPRGFVPTGFKLDVCFVQKCNRTVCKSQDGGRLFSFSFFLFLVRTPAILNFQLFLRWLLPEMCTCRPVRKVVLDIRRIPAVWLTSAMCCSP